MKRFRNIYLVRIVIMLVTLAILNVSIDPPDVLINIDDDIALEEDLSVNEMESISEVILEKVLEKKNAVSEADDNDSDTELKKVEVVMDVPVHVFKIEVALPLMAVYSSCHTFLYKSYSLAIVSPPPKA